MKKTILIAGGTGLVGSRLSQILKAAGHEVMLLSRRADVSKNIFQWNPADQRLDENALQRADVVINLAGAGIADGRWTARRKIEIIESRTQGAATFKKAFEKMERRPEAYLAASAIGFYGNSGEKLMSENDPQGTGFLAQTTALWEQATAQIESLGIRTVKFRIGVVLSKNGGALAEIIRPMRFGVAAYFADGQAWYSWISLEDVCRMFLWAVENQRVSGVFNAVAPQPERNIDLTRKASKLLKMPALIVPTPAFAIRLIFGEMGDVVLNSTRVSSEKIERAGFQFLHPNLEAAFAETT